MKLKTNPAKLLALFILFFVFLGVVFFGADGSFELDGLSDRAREAFKRIPISRDVETRESSRDSSRDRGRGRSEEPETDAPIGSDLEDGWWCVDPEATQDSESEGGGSETGGEFDPSSSAYKFIDPSQFSQFKIDPTLLKNLMKLVYIDTVADEDGFNVYVPPEEDDWLPKIKPGYEDDSIELDDPLRCFCLDKIYDIEWVSEDLFYGQLGGDEDAYCDYMFPPEYCTNPIDITCSCNDPKYGTESYEHTISEYQFENYWGGDSDAFCDDYYPPLWCDQEEWGCDEGEKPDSDLIDDMCNDAWAEMQKAATAGICGDAAEPNVTSDLIDLCRAAKGPSWGTFDYMDEYMCISYEDCLEYNSWYQGGYYTDMIKSTFGEDAGNEYLQSCFQLYGYQM